MVSVLDELRDACEEVAQRARLVHVDSGRIRSYAQSLPLEVARPQQLDPRYHFYGASRDVIKYVLTLDSVNFGSGYSWHFRKRVSSSAYMNVAFALKQRFEERGPFSADDLAKITADDCALLFDQDMSDPVIGELMRLFASALGDLGRYLLERYEGDYLNLVRAADHSAERLVAILAEMSLFQDIALYQGLRVPLYKRAQITAADLWRALGGQGLGHFEDLHRLTLFADNAVPHVLRMDGVLHYEPALAARIDSEEIIPSGSPAEVEIRACALHAVELIVRVLPSLGHREIVAAGIDNLLWNRAQLPEYGALPRHRTPCVYY